MYRQMGSKIYLFYPVHIPLFSFIGNAFSIKFNDPVRTLIDWSRTSNHLTDLCILLSHHHVRHVLEQIVSFDYPPPPPFANCF